MTKAAEIAADTPKPVRTALTSAWRPVLRKYSVATATIKKAFKPSRKVMSKVGNRTYALMAAVNYAICRSRCFWCVTVDDANFEATSNSQMHFADVHGIFDE